jgi:hypothetical protein
VATITNALTNAEYRKVDAISKSDLDYISKSPALMEWARNAHSDGSEAVERGTDLHCATLEPDVFAATYSRMPDYDLRTASGRANAESFRESMASSGRIILEAKQYDLVKAMRDSIMAHPTARAFLESNGRAENSIFWDKDGIKLKCRPDWIPDVEEFGHVLVDVKKVGDIDHIQRSIIQFRYNVQSAFYSDAYHQLTGHHPRFIFIAVGERRSIGRHPVRVFELPVDWVDDGRSAYLADLEVVKEVREFGFGLDVEVLQRPRWDK